MERGNKRDEERVRRGEREEGVRVRERERKKKRGKEEELCVHEIQ